MSDTLTFYDCATAPSPRRARILLAEKGVPYHTVQVDLRSGEQFSEAYRAVNPQCTVPALRLPDRGSVRRTPSPPPMPGPRQKAFRIIQRGAWDTRGSGLALLPARD